MNRCDRALILVKLESGSNSGHQEWDTHASEVLIKFVGSISRISMHNLSFCMLVFQQHLELYSIYPA